ncbi:MAG TPA: ATP-binding cassette domain-containing protein [Mycobacteriales bacterium]|nr:ATP-binding cassette domain-containing protein [Mycobacteriales bacterium]HVU62024.1 ATP-binding cassette domain-containing protein [Mycobacteriales bacterium]
MSVAVDLQPAEVVARLEAVEVRRGSQVPLHALDWTVRAGERWVVIGANGAGKSTLLGVLAGAFRPTSGRVQVLGEYLDEADLDDLLPRIGWASASLADLLPGEQTVLDVVLTATQGCVRRGDEDYSACDVGRACDLLAWVGARMLLERAFGTLSEGERKRVQLARSLMTNPEVLLLDEPAAGLDLGGREALLRTLGRLAVDRDGPVQVLISHHVEEIPAGTTHALLLREGRVVTSGPIGMALTSAALSATFRIPLRVLSHDGRFTARIA